MMNNFNYTINILMFMNNNNLLNFYIHILCEVHGATLGSLHELIATVNSVVEMNFHDTIKYFTINCVIKRILTLIEFINQLCDITCINLIHHTNNLLFSILFILIYKLHSPIE